MGEPELGRTPQPVGGADGLAERDRPVDAFAGDGPDRMGNEQLAVADLERGAQLGAAPGVGWWRRGEAVVDAGGGNAPLGELGGGERVDGDVAPRTTGAGVAMSVCPARWERVHVRPLGALPRRVVVVEQGPPPSEQPTHRPRRGEVQGDRAEVLDDDEVGIAEGGRHGGVEGLVVVRSGAAGGRRGTDGEGGDAPVDVPLPGDGHHGEAQIGEDVGPRCRHDRHPVGEPEAERHDGAGGWRHGDWGWR